MTELQSSVFKAKGKRNIVINPNDPQTKLLLLNKDISDSDIPEEIQNLITKNNLSTTKVEIEYSASDLSYYELLEKILPQGMVIPSGFETIGQVIHVNLKGNQIDYKYIIGIFYQKFD